MKLISKKEACRLLPLVIDGEANPEQYASIQLYLQLDLDMYQIYCSMVRIRKVIRTRLPRAPAPDHLKERIERAIRVEAARRQG